MDKVLVVAAGDRPVNALLDVAGGLAAGICEVLDGVQVVVAGQNLFYRWNERTDLVIYIGDHVSPLGRYQELIARGKALGARTVFWSLTDPWGMDFLPRQLADADLVASANRASSGHYLIDTKVIHLPPAATAVPERYLPKERPIDLLLPAGSAIVEQFGLVSAARPEKLIAMPHHPHEDELLAVYEGGSHWLRVLPRGLAAVYEHSRLAPHNEAYAVPRSTPTSRIWDFAANGIAPLMRDVAIETADYFEPDTELVVWSELGEVIDAIVSPAGRKQLERVGSAAWARMRKDHSYANRFRTIVSALADL